MDKEEAKDMLVKELAVYRQRSYGDLLYLLDTQDTKEITASSGIVYHLEFQAVWDYKKGGNLRVIGAIHDVRSVFWAIAPLTDDFIISPEGSFVGE